MGSIYKRKGVRAWWMSYFDSHGVRQRETTRTTDKATAMQVLADAEKRAAQRAVGMFDAQSDSVLEHARRPISLQISEFLEELDTKSRSKTHVGGATGKLNRIMRECDIACLADLDADRITRFARKLKQQGLSNRTVYSYLQAVKQFSRWAVQSRRLQSNPLECVAMPSLRSDRKRRRRALTIEEWQVLRETTQQQPESRGLTGEQRALMYEIALVTGLRLTEVLSICRRDLQLHGARPHITLSADRTKNRKSATQFLSPELAARLKRYTEHMFPTSRLFSVSDKGKVAKLVYADLAAAKRKWIKEDKTVEGQAFRERDDFLTSVNSQGEVLDFHSLRHTCGAWLALNGVHPKVIQSVMRHSSITLTLDTYGHLFPEQHDEAISVLSSAARGVQTRVS